MLSLVFLAFAVLPVSAHAEILPKPEEGLLITPVREFLSVDAGGNAKSTLSVANLTKDTLDVSLSVKQFAVTDYTYNYQFNTPDNDWVHLSSEIVHLNPNKTATVPYDIQVPSGSTPGGYYYTLFASASMTTQGVSTIVQATDLVYLTVNGTLSKVSYLKNSSISSLVFGKTIPFKLEPVNTGNVHSFVYVSGQLHGLFVKPATVSSAHILMPGKIRTLTDAIPSPIFPGIYRATYGYKTEGSWVIQQSHWVVYIPPWSIALLLALVLIAGKWLIPHKESPSRPEISTD